MAFFDVNGRCEPLPNSRTFSKNKNNYYRIKEFDYNLESIYQNLINYSNNKEPLEFKLFEDKINLLIQKINKNDDYNNLLNSPYIPFFYKDDILDQDLGTLLEHKFLPNLQKSFESFYPNSHFKAVLQGDSKLESNLFISPESRYQNFIDKSSDGLFGIYFPQTFQEFDIESQRSIINTLPHCEDFDVCLSGGIDICLALTGFPGLLINEKNYSPILCMSSFTHTDDRLILLLKSYGPHMEFWCMSQMLTPNTKQVSEQWSGGITIFSN